MELMSTLHKRTLRKSHTIKLTVGLFKLCNTALQILAFWFGVGRLRACASHNEQKGYEREEMRLWADVGGMGGYGVFIDPCLWVEGSSICADSCCNKISDQREAMTLRGGLRGGLRRDGQENMNAEDKRQCGAAKRSENPMTSVKPWQLVRLNSLSSLDDAIHIFAAASVPCTYISWACCNRHRVRSPA
jgi:hypothetical protein